MTGATAVLRILAFTFLDSRQYDKKTWTTNMTQSQNLIYSEFLRECTKLASDSPALYLRHSSKYIDITILLILAKTREDKISPAT